MSCRYGFGGYDDAPGKWIGMIMKHNGTRSIEAKRKGCRESSLENSVRLNRNSARVSKAVEY